MMYYKNGKIKRNNPEHRMCKEIMNWVRLCEKRYPVLVDLRHWPNEGKRNPLHAKEIGVKAGPLDFYLPAPTEHYSCLWLEIKVPPNKPSEAQYGWIKKMRTYGHKAEWTDTVNGAIAILDDYCQDAMICHMAKQTKITKLTPEQEQQIAVYRDKYFAFATSTKPVDLEAGKKAALRLAELAGVDNCEIVIVDNPGQGDSLWNSLRDSIRDSICASLRDSLWDSLRDSIRELLRDSLRESLWDSPWESLSASLWESLWDSLSVSIWASIWDASWLAYYSYAVEVLSIECSDRHRDILKCYTTIAENFTAIWIVPGKIILCNKPTNVTIKNSKVTDIKWRNV